MKKLLFLTSILVIAAVLRFWQLGANPASLDWDEASLGYNAYSILRTGKDEYGTLFPLAIRSFGDYKPPLYTYLTIPAVAAWGMNEFSVRFISALLGTVSVLIAFKIVSRLFGRTRLALLASFFFAISPWHIQFSRIAFEANVGLFFFLCGIYFLQRGIVRGIFLIPSAAAFACSLYAYHSPRLVVPLLLLGCAILYWRQLWQKRGWVIAAGILFAALVVPIGLTMAGTGARFGSVTVLNANERLGKSIGEMDYDASKGDWLGRLVHNRRFIFGREILGGYLDHFNFDFLFLSGDPPGRHHAVSMGMLYFVDLLFFPVGLYLLIARRDKPSLFVLLWFLVAPAASALTTGTPHAVRALLYLPTYQIFSAMGVLYLMDWRKRNRNNQESVIHDSFFMIHSSGLRFATVVLATLVFTGNSMYYQTMYWIHSPVEYASEWQYGYKQAVETVREYEDQVDRVVVTYRYDQPYVYFLFYNEIDPAWYQSQWGGGEIQRFNRDFGKYEFRNIDWGQDEDDTNVLFVGTAKEIPDGTAGIIRDIPFPDGTTAFRIVKR